ncbi:MAG: DUF3189 family protein [Pelotomaculaceae bacterium]|jgi:hypothetical protein|uniref:DUF3189 domain-containing protein n=1 Tax=anaerobic digester metagenome TaxID=1263854 RepID=A0A485M062_9ZZZZ|nr:DUF3189 family protein [Bacillota bacterium]
MKIIYHCYGGAHSSVTAAAIHLGLLPENRVPTRAEFCAVPLYDRQEADEHGHFFFMGKDQAGHEVFLTARRSRPGVLENIFTGLAEIFGIPEDDYYLVNVMGEVNLTMKLGGFLSRRWGAVRVGRPIVAMGTQAAYLQLVKLVQRVKSEVGGYSENTVLQRKHLSPGRPGGGNSHGTPGGGGETGQKFLEPAVFEYQKK